MICVVGSLNMDLVIDCQRIPSVGETVIGKQFHTIPGGKGANQAVACGRLGAETYMLGKVGNDGFADEVLTSLNESNVKSSKSIIMCIRLNYTINSKKQHYFLNIFYFLLKFRV